jgi:hypothetical protein
MQLIPVTKDGEYLEVHPVALVAHKALGWAECERVADTNADGKVTAAELKAALSDAGVKFHVNLGKDKLAALWAAFQRWGGDAEVWNNLSDEDKANRIAHVRTD